MPRRPARPITDADREQLRELHAEGLSRNEIARRMDRAQSTVSKLAAELDLDFDRTRTRAATAAKVVDAQARRAALALELLGDAEKMRRQLWEPAVVFNFGGRDNDYNERQVEKPPFKDQRDIVIATGHLVQQHLKLIEADASPEGLAAVDAWLRDITGIS
jgi:hypothetical protein